MRGGQRVALRELLVALESGGRPKGGVKGIATGVPSLGGEHLDANGGFRLERIRYVPYEFAASMRHGRIAVGDVLVVKDGATTGKVSLIRDSFPYKRAVINEHVFLCRCNERIDPRYLFWYLFSLEGQKAILSDFRGAAQGGISQRFADLVQVPLWPIDEQGRIVAEIERQVSRLDEAVANLKRVATRLNGYRLRVLDDAFTSKANSTLGEVICEGPQNGLYLPKDAYGSGTPIVRIDDYQTAWMRPVAELRRVRAAASQLSTWALKPGDLLVNRVNSMSHLGKCVVVPDALAGALFESNMMRFHLGPGALPRYVQLYLASRIGKRRLTAKAKWAVNQASINQKDLQATEIPLPSPEHQAQIVTDLDLRLSIAREVEAEVDANLNRARALRQACIAMAFEARSNGNAVTGAGSDQSASVSKR